MTYQDWVEEITYNDNLEPEAIEDWEALTGYNWGHKKYYDILDKHMDYFKQKAKGYTGDMIERIREGEDLHDELLWYIDLSDRHKLIYVSFEEDFIYGTPEFDGVRYLFKEV